MQDAKEAFLPRLWLYALEVLYGRLYSSHEVKSIFFNLWFNLKRVLSIVFLLYVQADLGETSAKQLVF